MCGAKQVWQSKFGKASSAMHPRPTSFECPGGDASATAVLNDPSHKGEGGGISLAFQRPDAPFIRARGRGHPLRFIRNWGASARLDRDREQKQWFFMLITIASNNNCTERTQQQRHDAKRNRPTLLAAIQNSNCPHSWFKGQGS
ncbi:hypothetical protein SELMODRAFT_423693 [Selaginella moellendorffii]|uniref:Uncharacterized protein n=1 Tax=Selaginella moellendorffii TaxID=88036 RepID=D8SMK7_SELML|nr:hypothetical protein SELMODRAFT_423693 [Selaginella moellendorffii]